MGGITRGSAFTFEGRKCIYEASIDDEHAMLFDEVNQVYITVSIGLLEPYRTPASLYEFKSPSEVASEDEWRVAVQRYNQIASYLATSRTKAELNKLRNELGLSMSRCYALISAYKDSDGPASLLRSSSGRKTGSRYLAEDVERVISSAIKTEWKGVGANQAAVIRRVQENCHLLMIKAPAKQTVINRIKERSEFEMMRLKEGMKRTNDKYQPRVNKNKALRPLEKTEMDHCLIDCIIVDDLSRKPLCRPWVTIIIDVYSRVALGVYLSVHAPSSYSVSMAVTHAAFPKDLWLDALGEEDLKYPYYGKPQSILMDNAKEFKSKPAQIAAHKHNVAWKFRPKHKPWWGGHIERLFGTLQVGGIQFLPGATLRNVVVRGDYDSEKNACFTFSEFRSWFIRNLQIYHNSVHSELKCTPHEQWVKGWTDDASRRLHPELLENPIEFAIDFYPEYTRSITRQGIELFGLQYWTGALRPYVASRQVVKYNPLSLRHIWVNPTGERYIKVPYQDITQPDISLEELTLAKKQQKDACAMRLSSSKAQRQEYFNLVATNRQKIVDAKTATKAVHKMRENRANSDFVQQTLVGRAPSMDNEEDNDQYLQPATPLRLDMEE